MYYLKSSVKLEPTIWGWYAWAQFLSPTTASLNLVNRCLKLMESFVSTPEIHSLAASNPALSGGAFVNLNKSQVPIIQALIISIRNNCKSLIELAEAINSYSNLLKTMADGHSLENLYFLIPDQLKGMIELVYDMDNNPSIRFIEPLLYENYYDNSGQGFILSETTKDYRPFCLSTPRLPSDEELFLKLPFNDNKIDELAKLRIYPKPWTEINSIFNLDKEKEKKLKNLFTFSKPLLDPDRNFNGKGIRVRYFGHACVLLETSNTKILIDPAISYDYQTSIKRFTFNDLPDHIDYVLFTHAHDDHVVFETLFQIRYKVKNFVCPRNNTGFLADPAIKLALNKIGFNSVITLEEFESLQLLDGIITAVPFLGEHCDLNIHSKVAYFIKLKNNSFLFAADSNNLDSNLYKNIFKKLGKLDVFFIGMECVGAPLTWQYGPLLTSKIENSQDQSRRLSGSDFKKALEIVELSKAQQVYVYAMGQEPWLNYIMALDYSDSSYQITESDKLIKACIEKGIISERLYIKKEWVIENGRILN
ncbi:N-acyl-phosphatidylethanolamine-hydrolyzing phospholipase D (plasmid) [Candidatus Megaera polyxenophila]|nr:N-acyl-phosphatidylethanolamine-hydrolyzing phospholipase D [Candidatus Megaera polyxenophila]